MSSWRDGVNTKTEKKITRKPFGKTGIADYYKWKIVRIYLYHIVPYIHIDLCFVGNSLIILVGFLYNELTTLYIC